MSEVYTDSAAQAEVLGMGNSPENRQIAARVLEKGPGAVLQEASMPSGMLPPPPSSNGTRPSSPNDMMPPSPNDQESEIPLMELRSEWMMKNQDEKVPWGDQTWGEFIDSVHDRAEKEEQGTGLDAAGEFIDQQLEDENRNKEKQAPSGMPILPTIPLPGNEDQMAAAANEMNVAQNPQNGQQGIMAAANGGLVRFAEGGMNQGALNPEEFMSVLGQEAESAGIPPEILEQITQTAAQSAPQNAANDNGLDSGIMQTVEAVETNETDMSGIGSLSEIDSQLINAGEEGLAHVSPGELIFDPSRLSEPDQRMLLAALETAGIDPDSATYGSSTNILNEMTGLPAFGFFSGVRKFIKSAGRKVKKTVKKVGKFLKKNAGTILGIAGALTGNPFLAALGAGVGNYITTGDIKSSLMSAGMAFVGTKWVGPWIGKQIQTALPSLGMATGNALAKGAGEVGATGVQGSLITETGSAVARQGLEQTALTAAVESATNAGTQATVKSVAAAASDALVRGGMTETAVAALNTSTGIATKAAEQAIANVGAELTGSALTAVPGAGFATSATQRLLAQPVAQLAGSAISGAGQMMAQPMINSMFETPEEEKAALAAWNERYDYVPSAQELYQFYTQEFVPGSQVDTSILGGTPGYTQPQTAQSYLPPTPGYTQGIQPLLSAAGGGYINGIGGPRTDSNLARLSDGEFVMTEPSVRGAGNGDRDLGAQRMLGIMQSFEGMAA